MRRVGGREARLIAAIVVSIAMLVLSVGVTEHACPRRVPRDSHSALASTFGTFPSPASNCFAAAAGHSTALFAAIPQPSHASVDHPTPRNTPGPPVASTTRSQKPSAPADATPQSRPVLRI